MSIDRRIPLLLLGFLALYVPTYSGLAVRVWTDSEEIHGPIVLAVGLWSLWSLRERLVRSFSGSHPLAWVLLCPGLIAYFLGRTLDILVLEVGSQLFVFSGLLWFLGGWRSVRLAIFPLLFLIFLIPLPSNLVDAMTGSLKQVVSSVAESLLYWAGYPVARSGVVISIGPYQLMVADACSGMKSMFSLSAMGCLYIYLMNHRSFRRNLTLGLSLLPIAFLSNVIRVLILILVTYHFGDAAGQGFIHEAAGMILFVVSILILSLLDRLLGIVIRDGNS